MHEKPTKNICPGDFDLKNDARNIPEGTFLFTMIKLNSLTL